MKGTPTDLGLYRRRDEQLRGYPWRCRFCGRALYHCVIVATAEDGTKNALCGECAELIAEDTQEHLP